MAKARLVLFSVLLTLTAAWTVSCAALSSAPPPAPLSAEVFADTQTVNLTVACGGEYPAAADFLAPDTRTALSAAGGQATFTQQPDFTQPGEFPVHLLLSFPDGSAKELTAQTKALTDTVPPTLEGAGDRSALVGEGVAFRTGVSVTDDCFGTVSLTVDCAADTSVPGCYPIVFTATDASGNRTSVPASLYVYETAVTEDMLWEKTDALLARLIRPGMTAEQKCREVYLCVRESIFYTGDADQSDWVRAAYTALFQTSRGDCFSYYAASRALLTWLGFACLPVQRTPGYTEDTHFWLMVNLAGEDEPALWYHFDPTRLRAAYNHSGCLLTDAQLAAYNAVRPDFYRYDAALYPKTPEQILTPTPELGLE